MILRGAPRCGARPKLIGRPQNEIIGKLFFPSKALLKGFVLPYSLQFRVPARCQYKYNRTITFFLIENNRESSVILKIMVFIFFITFCQKKIELKFQGSYLGLRTKISILF